MKRIGIDARLINQTGVGVYIRNLLRYLDTDNSHTAYYVYLLPQDFDRIIDGPNMVKRAAPYRWHSVDEQTRFLSLLRQDKLDLMHFTYFSFPYFYARPFVITIHDLTPLLFKTGKVTTLPSPIFRIKHTGYKHLLRRGISKAQTVIVPSQSVKKDIVHIFGKQYEDKIAVTYEGVDFELTNMKPDNAVLSRVQKPYFLYVGNSYPHKNVENLLRAYAQLNSTMNLVLVGPQDFFSKRITQLIGDLGIATKSIQLFNVSQAQKIALYKNAHALVQPSLSEGFGLPLLEAQYFGCPVIASNIPVFDEILSKNTPRFDPHDASSIAVALMRATKTKLNVEKTDTQKFSFEKMAQKTQQIYEQSSNRI